MEKHSESKSQRDSYIIHNLDDEICYSISLNLSKSADDSIDKKIEPNFVKDDLKNDVSQNMYYKDDQISNSSIEIVPNNVDLIKESHKNHSNKEIQENDVSLLPIYK